MKQPSNWIEGMSMELKKKKKLAVCVPFRDPGDGVRDKHLAEFVPYMNQFLSERGFDFKIFVAHQCDDKLFNRSAMKNIAFDVAREEGYDYFAFHDVDMLPEDGADYSYPNEHPVHIFTNLSQWDYRLRDIEYFGGCVLFTKEQFENVNGYYKDYWDWGMEDDDLFWRCVLKDYAKREKLEGPGLTDGGWFDGKSSYISTAPNPVLRHLTNRSFTMEFLVYGTIPSDVPQYLIGDEERKYKHFPICVRKGWDYRVAFDNSHTYSSTIWNFKNELYYSWIKRYSNEWTKIKVQVDDNERTIRFFINDEESNSRHGKGSVSPMSYDGRLKRYGGNPYYFGWNPSSDLFFRGKMADIKFYDHRDELVLHYDFSDVKNNIIHDQSGYDNHGELHNVKVEKMNIENLNGNWLPHRRPSKVTCLPHPDEGIVDTKFVKGETTARNERIYRLEMQKGKIDIEKHGLTDLKYKLLSKEKIDDTDHVMINVEL